MWVRMLHQDKWAFLPDNPDPRVQTFHHIDDIDGAHRTFYVPALKALVAAGHAGCEKHTLPVNRSGQRHLMKLRGIELPHARALSLSGLDEPGIGCLFGKDDLLFVDGNHRYIKRYLLGRKSMDFWVCKSEVWRLSLLEMRHHSPEPPKDPSLRFDLGFSLN